MNKNLSRILVFAEKMHLEILSKDATEALIVVQDEKRGIYNLVIDCEDPILVMEQLIYKVETPSENHYKRLLQMNRSLVHGAFVLDEEAKHVLFRDTLQIENLDFNEFEGTVNALSLGLAEFAHEIIELNKKG